MLEEHRDNCKGTSSALERDCAARTGIRSRDVQGMLLRGGRVGCLGKCRAALQGGRVPAVGSSLPKGPGSLSSHALWPDPMQHVLVPHHGRVEVCQAPVCAQPGTGAPWAPTEETPWCKMQVQWPWLRKDIFPLEIRNIIDA